MSGPTHVHLAYFGSELNCKECNKICGENNHHFSLDRGVRLEADSPWVKRGMSRLVSSQTIMPCGHPQCPMMRSWKPTRIRRMRSKGWKQPGLVKYVGRWTRWGNPYQILDGKIVFQLHNHDEPRPVIAGPPTFEEVVRLYRIYALRMLKNDPKWLEPLRRFNLSCFCDMTHACHVDVLIELLYPEGILT